MQSRSIQAAAIVLTASLLAGAFVVSKIQRVSRGEASSGQKAAKALPANAFYRIPSPNGQKAVELRIGSRSPLDASYNLEVDVIDGTSLRATIPVSGVQPWVHRDEVVRWLGNNRVLVGWQKLYDQDGEKDLGALIEQAAGVKPSEHFPIWGWAVDQTGTKLAVYGQVGPDSGDRQAVIVVADLDRFSAERVVSMPLGKPKLIEEAYRSIYWGNNNIYFDGVDVGGDFTVFKWDGTKTVPFAKGVKINGMKQDGSLLSVLRPDVTNKSVSLEIIGTDGVTIASSPVGTAPLTWWDKIGERFATFDITTGNLNAWRLTNGNLVLEGAIHLDRDRVAGVSDVEFAGQQVHFIRWGSTYDQASGQYIPDVAMDSGVLK